MSSLSPLEHTAIGALAGLTEVSLMQPTVALKNALQEGRALPRTPLALYRGYAVSAGSMFPITAVQFGMNRYLDQAYINAFGSRPGNAGQVGVAMAAGSTSALFGCAAEFVMIQQQKHGRPLGQEIKTIITNYGPLSVYKGLSATILRESLYTGGYLGALPIMQAKLQEVPAVSSLPGGPMIVSGLAAGLMAAVTTQPFDTIKTRMQAFPDPIARPEYRSLVSTASHIVKEEGVATLFAGLTPRALRIVCAVFILTGTRNVIIDEVEKRRTPIQTPLASRS